MQRGRREGGKKEGTYKFRIKKIISSPIKC
jgi:hypothetical protein